MDASQLCSICGEGDDTIKCTVCDRLVCSDCRVRTTCFDCMSEGLEKNPQ